MSINRIFITFGIFLAFSLVVPYQGWSQLAPYTGGAKPKPGTHAPIITQAFAVDKGYYGTIWRIYIEAEDPDGDMLKIAAVVDQAGYGHYPTDWIFLRSKNQKYLKGYLQWNTFSSKASYLREWTEITLRVSVIDKALNESNVVVFPFTFETGVRDYGSVKPSAPFDQGEVPRLGYIHIDLFEPTQMGNNGGSFD